MSCLILEKRYILLSTFALQFSINSIVKNLKLMVKGRGQSQSTCPVSTE